MNESETTFDDEDVSREASGETTTYKANALSELSDFTMSREWITSTTTYPDPEKSIFATATSASDVTTLGSINSSGDFTTNSSKNSNVSSQTMDGLDSKLFSSQTTDAVTSTIFTSQSTKDLSTLPIDDSGSSSTLSAPILAVVAILAVITILLFFSLFIRFYFCKRASYYINESQELKPLNSGNTEQYSQPVGSTGPEKEYLV